MNIFVVVSIYFNSGYFGVYSTLKRARIAFEDFLGSDENIVAFESLDDYWYQFTTKIGEIFTAEICWDYLDEEFIEGTCKDN